MQNANAKIQNFLEKHKIEKRHLFILLLLSVTVIVIVCVSLITPAISMSRDIICDREEHIHNEQCYSNILICNVPETEGHIHDDRCYETNLVCEKDEHSHTVECYEETNNTEPESEQINNQAGEPEDSDLIVLDPVDAEKNVQLNVPTTFSSGIANLNGNTTVIGDSSVDFGNFIKKIDCKEVVGNESEDFKTVKFTINYTLPGNTLMNNNENRQIYCLLPDNVVIGEPKEGIVMREGKEIGTYQITVDGYVIIDFDPNFVKDGSTPITGDVSFNANVLHRNTGTDYETVTIGKGITTVPFPAEPTLSEDLSVNKMFVGEYDKDQHKAHYKIEIKSYNGSGTGNITLKDEFTGEHKIFVNHDWNDGDTVTFTKSDGSPVTATVKISDDGKSAVIEGLPPLGPNESYSLEYTATVTSDNQTPIINTINKASISNGILTDSAECNKQIAVNCGISKNGQYNSKTDMIEWTIKVTNPSGKALNGYTITDDMLGSIANGLVIKDDKGNIIETLNAGNTWSGTVGSLDNNVFSFGDNSNGAGYILFYETKLPDRNQIAGNQVSNKAILKHDDIQINAPVATTWISDDRQYIYKSLNKTSYDETGNITADWLTKLEFQVGDFSGQTFIDTISTISYDNDNNNDYHYMTPAQKGSLAIVGYDAYSTEVILTQGIDYSVMWCDKDGNPMNSETDNIYSFKILFENTDNIAKLCDVNISYSTTGITSDMQSGDVREYHNQADFIGKTSWASCWEKIKEPFYKYDCSIAGQISSENETHHNANELEKTANGELILKWYITANESHNWSDNDAAVFTDTLPEGVILNESKISYSISQNNGNLYDLVRNAPIMHTVSTNEKGQQSVNFIIPAGFHEGKPFRVQYEVIVSEDYLINNKDARGNTYFKNTVTDGNYTSEQTQVIERTLITKAGADPAETYDGYINYTIDVNPKAELLSNNGKVTLKDTMNYQYMAYIPTLTSLEVYTVSVDENGIEILTPLDTSKYKLKTYDDGVDAKFVIELPDKTHLKIKYIYHCVYKDNSVTESYDWGTSVYNSAVLEFDNNLQNAKFEDIYQLTKHSEAHAVTNNNIKISKVDSENYGIKLKGAGFSVYMWNDGKWLTLTDIVTDEDDNDIKNPVWGGEEGTEGVVPYIISTDDAGKADMPKIQSGVLYKILEQTAPQDYIKSQLPHYFALDSAPIDSLPDDKGFNAQNVQILHNGGIINIPNTKMQKTEIAVRKYWHEASGFTGEHGDIDVELYQSHKDSSGKINGPEITFNFSDSAGNAVTKNFNVEYGSDMQIEIRTLDAWYEEKEFDTSYIKITNEQYSRIFSISEPIYDPVTKVTDRSSEGEAFAQYMSDHNFNWNDDKSYGGWIGSYVDGWQNGDQYGVYIMTFENVTENITWDVHFTKVNPHSQYAVFIGNQEVGVPINGLPDDAVLIGTETLNSRNDWTHIWNDIPATDEFGYKYYYYVKEKEESIPADYTVSYSNNGANSGTISITNTGKGYTNEMPATGGTGVKQTETVGAILISGSVSLYFLIKRRSKRIKT